MAFPQRPTLDTLAVTRPVARRLSDRAVFAWGVAWNVIVTTGLAALWWLAAPNIDPVWTIVTFVNVAASTALTIALSRVDATLVVSLAPAMLLIALESTTAPVALAVWGTASFVGAIARFRHLGDAAEVTAYAMGGALAVTLTHAWLEASGVPWLVWAPVCTAVYLLARLAMSSVRLSVVIQLSAREALGELLVRRAVLCWLLITGTTAVGLGIQALVVAYHPTLAARGGGSLAMILIGFSAFAIGVLRELRIVAIQLSGTLEAALALPWAADTAIDDRAQRFAQLALPWYHIELRQDEGRNVNELVSPLADGYLVARRGSIQPPFVVQEQRVLDAIAHIAETMAATHQERESLSLAASTDALTGLPNYRAFREALTESTAQLDSGIAVVYIDVDGFKDVNDRYGHETGNAVLQTIATRLRTHLPFTDLVARVGGDEFVLILTNVGDEDDGHRRTTTLLAEVSAPVLLGGLVVPIRLSSGVAFGEPGSIDVDALVEAADTRMYAGRGRQVGDGSAHPEPRPVTTTTAPDAAPGGVQTGSDFLDLADMVALSITERRLSVRYQPIVDRATDRIIAVEALVRSHDAGRNGLPVDLIIHEARRLGLLTELSTHIMSTAVADMRRFRKLEPALADLHVNIDIEQVTDPAFIAVVTGTDRSDGLHLTLELSETSLARSTEDTYRELERWQTEFGIRVALDDFGRDSSTLLSMLQYPLDVLKIDKSLIRSMSSRKPQLLIRSLARLTRSLNVQMVVEGVEDDATSDELTRVGVRYMQGYRYGRPMSADRLAERLTDHGLRADIGLRVDVG